MDVVKKAKPSRVFTSGRGTTIGGTEDVQVRLIGGLSAPGINDLEAAVPQTGAYREPLTLAYLPVASTNQNARSAWIFIPGGERSSCLADW
jgi:hypothetical protein